MIKMNSKEYREGDRGVRDTAVTFFGIPLYRSRTTTTNNMIVRQLTVLTENRMNINGFKNNG